MICGALALLAGSTTARALTQQEKAACDHIYRYMTDRNYTCEFDSRDESLNFRYNGTLYWITFKANNNDMIYTLHRKPIIMAKEGQNQFEANLDREKGTWAANLMTGTNTYKAFLTGNKIDLQFPNISSSTEEYCKVLMSLLNEFESSKTDFNQEFYKATEITDSIHSYWSSPSLTMEKMPSYGNQPSPLMINKVEFQNVASDGKVLSEYGYPLLSSQMEYLQPRVNLQASDKAKGSYVLILKIIDPYGKTLVKDWALNFTANSIVEVKNTNAQNYPLSLIGTEAIGFWVPGAYRIEIYNEGDLIYKQLFTIHDN